MLGGLGTSLLSARRGRFDRQTKQENRAKRSQISICKTLNSIDLGRIGFEVGLTNGPISGGTSLFLERGCWQFETGEAVPRGPAARGTERPSQNGPRTVDF